jgi:excisionase family DNA binding protein
MDLPAPLTVADVAVELGCSVDDVRALIREGQLQTVSCGIRPSLVPRHQLDDYLRRNRSTSAAFSGSAPRLGDRPPVEERER